MTSTADLVEGISSLLEISSQPIPISLMNHPPELAYEIICSVVERCGEKGMIITEVSLDPEFAQLANLRDGDFMPLHSNAVVHCQLGLGRQILFRKR
jgi:hypothetical protein